MIISCFPQCTLQSIASDELLTVKDTTTSKTYTYTINSFNKHFKFCQIILAFVIRHGLIKMLQLFHVQLTGMWRRTDTLVTPIFPSLRFKRMRCRAFDDPDLHLLAHIGFGPYSRQDIGRHEQVQGHTLMMKLILCIRC